MKSAWTELQLLRDIIFILASEGWQKAIDEKDDLKAVDRVMEKFKIPLQAANVVGGSLKKYMLNLMS